MLFYGLQLDQKSTTYWRLPRQRGLCLHIHRDIIKTNSLITSIPRKQIFICKERNDNLDRQIKIYQPDGIISESVYDSQGRVWKSIIRAGNDVRTTEYKYDMYGNIIETIQPDGTTIKATYNVKGQKISETNQLNQTRYFEYDDNGQLVKVILPDGTTYKYAYNAQGNQTSIIDPLNREIKFTYDDNGNQLTRTLPDGSTEYFEYDYKGRLIKQISFEGVETTYNYDEFERLLSKTFTANGISETWIYTYDQFGRVSEVNQNGRIVKTTYDSQGRTKSIETPEGIISYTYDEFGRQTSVQTDNDPPTIYSYDNYGRLSSVTSDGKTTTYEYDSFGNLAKTTLPNGVITTYEYDNMNRLIKETNYIDQNNNGTFDKDQGEGIAQFEYGLDAQGRKISAIEKFWKDIDNDNVIDELFNDIKWTYDDDGRLVKEVFDHYDDNFDQTLLWEYDLVSNRTSQKLDKGNDGIIDEVTKYTYDENDRLLTELHDGQNDGIFEKATTYGYDHTQQTSKTVHIDGTKLNETTYKYNLQGRMSVVTITTFNENGTIAKGERISYEYDENGIRISTLHEVDSDGDGVFDTAKLTEYLNDPLNITGYSQVLRQTETDLKTGEQTIVTNIIGLYKIAQITVKNGSRQELYFTFDGHGSTRVLTDFTGAIIELYSYDAFGNALGFNPSETKTEFLYSGEQFDSKIGQQYLRQRYYDPSTGIFNRLDPFFGNLNDPLSLHKYIYANADPINMIDPNGLFGVAGIAVGMSLAGNIVSTKNSLDFMVLDVVLNMISGIQSGKSAEAILMSFLQNQAMGMLIGFTVVKSINFGSKIWQEGMAVLTPQRSVTQIFNRPLVVLNQQNGRFGMFRTMEDVAVSGRNASRNLGFGEDRIRRFGDVYQQKQVKEWNKWIENHQGSVFDARLDQRQVGIDGKCLGINRPDIQFTLKGGLSYTLPNGANVIIPSGENIRVYVEFDNLLGGAQYNLNARRGPKHLDRILANDPNGIVILDLNNKSGQIGNVTVGPGTYLDF